jgi:hypothetical protein
MAVLVMRELRTVDFALERLSEAGCCALSGDQRIYVRV